MMALLFIYRLTSGGFPAGRAIVLRVSIYRNIIYTRRVTFNVWYRCRLVVHINILKETLIYRRNQYIIYIIYDIM